MIAKTSHPSHFTYPGVASQLPASLAARRHPDRGLDVPSSDMLADLGEKLHGRNVRFVLVRMIMPVRHMLELAGVMEKIKPADVFIDPTEAALDYLLSQCYDAGIQELQRSAANTMRSLLQTGLSTTPVERKVALAAIVDHLDKEIKQ